MCRTTLPLDPKRSDGRIVYNSREKEDSLSLRKSNLKLLDIFSFLLSHVFFSFVLFLPFCFYFFSFSCLIFPSFLLLISLSFSPHFLLFSLNFSPPFWSIDRMGQKEEVSSLPSSSQMCGFPFSFFFFYFIILLYDIITYMA